MCLLCVVAAVDIVVAKFAVDVAVVVVVCCLPFVNCRL